MTRIKNLIAISFASMAGVILLAGCEIEDPPPPPPSPPEITSEIRDAYQDLVREYLHPEALIPGARKRQALEEIQRLRAEYQGTEHGPEAISEAAEQLEDLIREAYYNRAWSLTIFAVQALQTLEPNNTRFQRFHEQAVVRRNRPRAQVTGFFEDPEQDVITVFMRVYLPAENRIESVQVREGEEFLGLRLIEVVGRNQGVRLQYMATEEEYQVPMRG